MTVMHVRDDALRDSLFFCIFSGGPDAFWSKLFVVGDSDIVYGEDRTTVIMRYRSVDGENGIRFNQHTVIL